MLREAKAAKIPVILTDRAVDVKDDSPVCHASWARTSSRKAARPAAGCSRTRRTTTGDVNIVELQGTVGSAPAIDRKKGFEEIIKADPQFKIIRSQTGDFTRAKGKEVMEAFLKAEGKKINVLYAHNDDMAIGAIQAIEEAGHEARQGHHSSSRSTRVKGAFEAMIAGKLNVSVECSPLLGPQLMAGREGRGGRQDAAASASSPRKACSRWKSRPRNSRTASTERTRVLTRTPRRSSKRAASTRASPACSRSSAWTSRCAPARSTR